MSLFAALMAGVVLGLGLWLAVLTGLGRIVVGARRGDEHRRPRSSSSLGFDSTDGVFAVVAVAAAIAIAVSTKLVVAALAAAIGILLIPRVMRARAERERAVAKMRAAAEFVESIRGSLGAGSGLEAAIVESARRPPAGLADELADFVAVRRLPEVTTEQALRRLADQADEPAVDLLVGSLLAALRGGAGDMGRLFERIADQGRSFAETRAHTQAERAKVEFQTRVLSLLVVAVGLFSVVISPDLTSAYDASAIGQLRLLIPVLVFGLGWWWLTRMNQVESMYRFRLRPVRVSGER